MKKILLLQIVLFFIQNFCFSQTERTILGFSLDDTKDSIYQKLEDKYFTLIKCDDTEALFPIRHESYSKVNLTYNGIPVKEITFSYCYDQLFCIKIVTENIDDIDLLIESRRLLKEKFSLEKNDFITISRDFYDKESNVSFYTCNENPDFILLIYGKEDKDGSIPQTYNFMYQSKANSAIELKDQYQTYSMIPGYTKMSLEELEEIKLVMDEEEKERQDMIKKQKIEEEKQKKLAEEKQREEYNKKHRFDNLSGGYSGFGFGLGFINGNYSGGFVAFDWSYNFKGPFSVGLDWRIGGLQPASENDSEFKMDYDVYLSLGIALPLNLISGSPILYIAAAPGFYFYKIKDMVLDGFIDLRAGIILPLSSNWDLKFVYSREFLTNNEQMNIYSFYLGGRF